MLVTNPATGETKRFERAVEMTLQGGAPQVETSAWYPVSEAFDLAPGTYQARVAMRDRNSGRIGAVTHDFDVPVRKGMTLSSLIVTDTIEKPADGSGPPKAVLMVRRLLNAGTTLYYQFAVFDAGRTATGETRVKAGHVVRRADGTVVKELKPTALVPGPSGMSRFAGISLAGLPAGEYRPGRDGRRRSARRNGHRERAVRDCGTAAGEVLLGLSSFAWCRAGHLGPAAARA